MIPTTTRKRTPLTKLSRRQILQAGGIGALNLTLPGMVAARVEANRPPRGVAAEKSCIFILLCGGPSHLDTWDLKPDAPEGIRGPYRPISTTVPGMQLSELHPRMARLARHFSLIRSMTHVGNISNHFDAMHHCLSGQSGAPDDSAYIGSVLAKVRRDQRSLASYVWLIRCVGDPVFCAPNIGSGGHLGSVYAPLFIGSANNHPAMANFRPPDELLPVADRGRMLERRRLLNNLSSNDSLTRANPIAADWQEMHERAFDLANGPGVRQVFDMDREPTTVRDRYGRHPLGQNLLLARRLVEAGVGFVTVNGWTGPSPHGNQGGTRPVSSSWDMHGGHMGMGNAFSNGSYGMGWCLPRLDESLSALLDDLRERGMLKDTLVVVIGEFGRSPRINTRGAPGRVHWPSCFSAILAGGGIRGGSVYGRSDRIGGYVQDSPVRPQDLGATVYHALGVPLDYRLGRDGVSRPVTTGRPLMNLFG